MTKQAKINDVAQFITGGKAIVTITNTENKKHVTLRFNRSNDGRTIFVSVLRGTDNMDDDSYTFIGNLWPSLAFTHGKRSKLGSDSVAVRTGRWIAKVARGEIDQSPVMEIHHGGRCCFCRRSLTQTESIKRGYGPSCADKRGLPYGAVTKRARETQTSNKEQEVA